MKEEAVESRRVRFGDEVFWSVSAGLVRMLVGAACGGRVASQERLRELLATRSFPFSMLRAATQVHGSNILDLDSSISTADGTVAIVGECDGMTSTTPGLGMAIWTADCVPVLLAGRTATASVHAGWRGAAAGIVPEAIDRLERKHGEDRSTIVAVIGPAVGACHYPVGPEVRRRLLSQGVESSLWVRGDAVDLRSFLRGQLLMLGIPAAAIHTLGACTACSPELASYRRDGTAAGRQVSISGIAAGP